MAMPDVCYEKCKAPLDAVSKADLCAGTALRDALSCLDQTGILQCYDSVFSERHKGECAGAVSNTAVRNLDETEDATELLVNGTTRDMPLLMASSRRLINLRARCAKAMPDMGSWSFRPFFIWVSGSPTQWDEKDEFPPNFKGGQGMCIKIVKSSQAKNTLKKAITKKSYIGKYQKKGEDSASGNMEFVFQISWIGLNSHTVVDMYFVLCQDLAILFGLTKPFFAEFCIGGKIKCDWKGDCPEVKNVFMSGKVYWIFDIGLDFWVIRISFASLELGIAAGVGYLSHQKCWWYWFDGWGRRRWWRRRRHKTCHWSKSCDVYIKGYVKLTITVISGALELKYWTKTKVIQIIIKLWAWLWKWWIAFNKCIYQRTLG